MPLIQGRKRRANAQEDPSPQPSPEPATQRRRTSDVSDDEAFGSDDGTQADSNMDQMVKKMVRLALACEYQRRPIRRSDISEKVLGSAGRRFKNVFNQAQLQLRSVFGMEMVELPAREKVTLAQRRAAQKQSQAKSVTSWILISVLPPQYRHPGILSPPAVPTPEEESKYTAIYTLLISLISLSGGTLADSKMERYLRRIDMEDHTPVDAYAKTEDLLKRLERDGYIYKVKETTGTGEDDVSWIVGPRGKTEVGDDGVRGLARAVYGEQTEADEKELERKIERSLGIGERVVPRRDETQNAEPKKRGRRRKNAEDEQDPDEDDEGEEIEEDD